MSLETENIEKNYDQLFAFDLSADDMLYDRDKYSERLSSYYNQYQDRFLHSFQCAETISDLIEAYTLEELQNFHDSLGEASERLQEISDMRFNPTLSESEKKELLREAQDSLNDYIESKTCSALALTALEDDPLPVSDGEENNSLRTVGVAVAMGAAFISGINPENVGQPEKTAELFGRYMVQVENEKKKSAGMDQAGQQDHSGEPPAPVNSLNLGLGKKGVVVTFPNVSEIKDFDTPQKMDEKILDESSDFKDPAIEKIVKNANFSTSPFRKFEADHGTEKQEDSATIEEIKNVISEKAENCIEKLASTAPFSTEFLNEQRMKLKEHADTVADSGDNFKNREVHQGDVFVRICAGSDRGISPFFTNEDEIAKVSFKSDDGILHINEPKFRDKFALPENSRLEQCQVFKAKEDFNAYVSEIAPSTELWGVVKHSGGAEQTIILDREKLSFVETVAVINDTEEEFSHIESKNNQSKG